jgi:tetratricopeptide (TPR) repeat protein
MLKELLTRRVPQIVGGYFATGWLVLEFTDWAVNRYLLSGHLTDFVVAGWLLLLPAVFMLAWFHGKPGRDRWSRGERIGIAVNLVVAAAILFSLFRGTDLGAATTTVVVEDEEGNTIERVIPKSEFRKSLVLFPFVNETGKEELDWLESGLRIGIQFDMIQDPFVTTPGDVRLAERLRQEGLDDGSEIPLTLKRQLADRLHVDHFISGTIGDSAGAPVVTVSLYETERGKLLQQRSFPLTDALALADRISLQLRYDLELPTQHIESTADLVVAELLSTNPEAYRAFVAGEDASSLRRDFEMAAEQFERAVELDSTFALAWIQLFAARTVLNDAAAGERALDRAQDYMYRLPERVQFPVRAITYWIVRRDMERAIATSEMWTELYPDDVEAHENLAGYYEAAGRRAEARAERERILELDPGRIGQLQMISGLYRAEGEFASAMEYLERYAAAAPDDPAAFTGMGDLHRRLGASSAARQSYNRALALDPGDVGALVRLATLSYETGEFGAAESGLAEAMEAAGSPADSVAVHGAWRSYRLFRGQSNRAIERLRRRWAVMDRTLPPFDRIQNQMSDLGTYARAGRQAEGKAVLDSLVLQLAAEYADLSAIGRMNLSIDGDDPDAIEEARVEFAAFLDSFGLDQYRFALPYADGRVAELRGDCRLATRRFSEAMELNAGDAWIRLALARCLRLQGDYRAARDNLEYLLDLVPVHPDVHYELALVLEAEGDTAEAIDHLRTSLGVWEEADPDFPVALKAREKLAELQAEG